MVALFRIMRTLIVLSKQFNDFELKDQSWGKSDTWLLILLPFLLEFERNWASRILQRSEVESGACKRWWVPENLHCWQGFRPLQSCLRLQPRVMESHSSRSLEMDKMYLMTFSPL